MLFFYRAFSTKHFDKKPYFFIQTKVSIFLTDSHLFWPQTVWLRLQKQIVRSDLGVIKVTKKNVASDNVIWLLRNQNFSYRCQKSQDVKFLQWKI
jgi:hypothetical protein